MFRVFSFFPIYSSQVFLDKNFSWKLEVENFLNFSTIDIKEIQGVMNNLIF